jgi:hypothetical protein
MENKSVDLLIVDDKAGKAYSNLFKHGKEVGDYLCRQSPPSDNKAKVCADLLNRMDFDVLCCEDATIAYLILPAIEDARPRAALIGYTQGSIWGMTPLGVKGILFDDETPSLLRGTDLAKELRLAFGMKIYIHLVSDFVGASGSDSRTHDFDKMVKSGLIDSYSRRSIIPGQHEIGITVPADNNLADEFINLSLEPLKILVAYLTQSKR